MIRGIAAIWAAAVPPLVLALSTQSASAWPSDFDPGQEFRYNYHSYAYKASQGGDATGPHGVGSEAYFYSNAKNLAAHDFHTYGNGNGSTVKNNAGSAYNISGRVVRVYYNSYGVMGCWCGANDAVGWGARDLSVTKNENASHRATAQVA